MGYAKITYFAKKIVQAKIIAIEKEIEKLKEQFKGKDKPKGDPIPIPEIPKIEIELDKDKKGVAPQASRYTNYARLMSATKLSEVF